PEPTLLLILIAAGTAAAAALALWKCGLGFGAAWAVLVGGLLAAVRAEAFLPAVAAIGGFLLAVTVSLLAADRPRKPNWVRDACGVTLLFSAAVIGIGFGVVLMGLGGGVATFIFLVIATFYVILNRKTISARELEVVSTLSSLMDQRLPLPRGLHAAADSRPDGASKIFRRIARRVEAGIPLSRSMEGGWSRCPGWLVAMVRQGEQVGRVADALRLAERRLRHELRSLSTPRAVSLVYPVLVILYALSLINALSIFVLPSFQALFKDQGMQEEYDATAGFVYGAHEVYSLLLQGVILCLVVVGWTRLRARRVDRPRLLSRLGDLAKWNLPVARWMERKAALAQVCEFVGLGLRSGTSAERVLAGAAELDVNLWYRRRLRKWHRLVKGGQSIPDAARQARLEPVLVWALEGSGQSGDVPDVLEAVARTQRDQRDFRMAILRNIIGVGLVLVTALLIGGFAWTFVSVLRALLDAASVHPTP
ncbi:MAG: type II secretion system F family protein, partial [Phycisphaerae bacterium]